MEALSQLSYSPETVNRSAGSTIASLRRNELRHVEVVSGIVIAARPANTGVDAAARAGLIESRGHPAVRQAHVAQQALGVVAQRDGQLAQVARELGALTQDLAGDDVRLADDLGDDLDVPEFIPPE